MILGFLPSIGLEISHMSIANPLLEQQAYSNANQLPLAIRHHRDATYKSSTCAPESGPPGKGDAEECREKRTEFVRERDLCLRAVSQLRKLFSAIFQGLLPNIVEVIQI